MIQTREMGVAGSTQPTVALCHKPHRGGIQMPGNYLTLTRQSLYDLVWSTPMSTLAKDFGISDVALAKRCRVVDVPVPPRGYWARRAAGQDPPRTPLPR